MYGFVVFTLFLRVINPAQISLVLSGESRHTEIMLDAIETLT